MNYRLRNIYSQEPNEAITDILHDRGVKNVNAFINPTKESENNPYDLNNIKEAAERLLYHLQHDSYICILTDADNDGFAPRQ